MGRSWGFFVVGLALGCSLSTRARAQLLPAPVTPPNDGHFDVSLNARSSKTNLRAEQVAWLTVTLPLDQLALPKITHRVAAESVAPTPAPTPEAQAETTTSPRAPFTLEQLRALAEFSRRTSAMAVSVVGAGADRKRLDSLSSRARSSALLPELRLRAVRNTDRALRLVPTTDDPYRVSQADGAGLILEASATFRLDRLLFAREELVVERLRAQAAAERLKLEARVQAAVLGLFHARQQACSVAPEEPARALQIIKALEFFQELDALTAGWFSAQAGALSSAVWGFPEAILGACEPPEPPKPPVATKAVASLEDSE